MEPILDYLRKEHEVLKQEKDPTGRCIGIAAEVAVILTQSGKPPDIIAIEEIIKGEDGQIRRRRFKPTLFDGIEWEGHEFCRYDGKIYDPLIGEPIPEEEYCKRAFGEDLPMKVVITSEYVRDFLNR